MAQRPGVAIAGAVDEGPPLRQARIDLESLKSNVQTLGATFSGFVIDVAADAYGHGAVEVARAARSVGALNFLVRNDGEAKILRSAGIVGEFAISAEIGSDSAAATFGIGPIAQRLRLAPVMRVGASVMSVKVIAAGEPVSYGYTWRAKTTSRLALVPLGYADGLSRAASNLGEVWLSGALRPIVGRVAMDVCVLDLGEDDSVVVGDEALLFGDPRVPQASVERWAAALDLSVLEVTTGVGARVVRRWVP